MSVIDSLSNDGCSARRPSIVVSHICVCHHESYCCTTCTYRENCSTIETA